MSGGLLHSGVMLAKLSASCSSSADAAGAAAVVEPVERSCLGATEEALSGVSVLSAKAGAAALFSRRSAQSMALLAPAPADASKMPQLMALAGSSTAHSMTADAAGIALLDVGSAGFCFMLEACMTIVNQDEPSGARYCNAAASVLLLQTRCPFVI